MRSNSRQEMLNRQGGVLAILLALMVGFSLWALIFRAIPDANQNVLLVLIGILSRDFATVVNFHFSSTSETKKQTEAIGDLAATAKSAQAALAPLTPTPDIVVPAGDSVTVKADDTAELKR